MNRVLGIDLGDARVGVAVSDDLGMLAHPLETIQVKSGNVVTRVAALVKDRQATTVVVGMPRNMDGTFGPAAEKAREFIQALKSVCESQIVPWDERLSTVAAQRSLQEAGRKARDHRAVIDQVAAQIILQSWLDSQA
jgi:putative Holliday junction resolvase